MSQSIRNLFLCICVIGMLSPAATAAKDVSEPILIVANKSVSANKASLDEIKAIFLKKKFTWKTGGKAIAITPSSPALRAAFAHKVLGMNPTQEKAYWQDFKIKKGTTAPPEFGNNLKAVYKIKGSVSYIFKSQYKEGVVKILLEL